MCATVRLSLCLFVQPVADSLIMYRGHRRGEVHEWDGRLENVVPPNEGKDPRGWNVRVQQLLRRLLRSFSAVRCVVHGADCVVLFSALSLTNALLRSQGVDFNRQWPAFWSAQQLGAGDFPFSELE